MTRGRYKVGERLILTDEPGDMWEEMRMTYQWPVDHWPHTTNE